MLKLMYITNDPTVAKIAQKSGVDRIWIDLEWRGKEERQSGRDTVKSKHTPEDISAVRKCLTTSKLMVRVNPLFSGSSNEIDDAICRGADLIMLPMFHTADEAAYFVKLVNGRAKTMLLVETPDAVNEIQKIVSIKGIDEIHIGLNDLHLAYHMQFMFQLLAEGYVERLCKTIRNAGITYGFGGIANLNSGLLPARLIIAEHYRLGSDMAILSRSFCDTSRLHNPQLIEKAFRSGVQEIRDFEVELSKKSDDYFMENQREVQKLVYKIKTQLTETI